MQAEFPLSRKLEAFEDAISRYQEVVTTSGMISAIDYGQGAESGKATNTGNSQMVKVSDPDFIADVENATKRCLDTRELVHFNEIYKPQPYKVEFIVPSNVTQWPASEPFKSKKVVVDSEWHTGAFSTYLNHPTNGTIVEYRANSKSKLMDLIQAQGFPERDSDYTKAMLLDARAQQRAEVAHTVVGMATIEYKAYRVVSQMEAKVYTRFDQQVRSKLGAELLRAGISPHNKYREGIDVRAPRKPKGWLSHLDGTH